MEDNDQIRMQSMIDEIDVQHERLKTLSLQQKKVKRNLAFFRFVKVFRERSDVYHVDVTVTKDLEQVETLTGEKVNPINTIFGTYMVVGIVLPSTFHYSLVENKFSINLSVHFNQKRLCRQVIVDKEHTFIVIPWIDLQINSELDILILGKVQDKKVVFRIPTILLDLSYFLKPVDYPKKVSDYGQYKQHLLEVSRLYCTHKKSFYEDYKISYKMIVPNGKDIQAFLMKCFPQDLKKSQKPEDLILEILRDTCMPSQVNIKINKNFIEILSSIENLLELKSYLIAQMYYNDIKETRALKKFLTVAENNEIQKEYKDAYKSLRKIWEMD